MQHTEMTLCLTVVLLMSWTLGGKNSFWEGCPRVQPESNGVSWGTLSEAR